MRAYVLIEASPGKALDIARQLQGQPGITSADAITGEYDVVAVCEAPDVNAMGQLVVGRIQKTEGVFKTITNLVVA